VIATLRMCLRVVVMAFALMVNVEVVQAAGSLAIGSCGAYGYAYDHVKAESARSAAKAKCTGDCTTVEVRKHCAALAVDVQNACGPFGYSVAKKLGEAQNEALSHCYKHGGKDCMIRAWLCDSRG
jgi:hypothetical protein